ncbi:enoyl-CoA hydratase/isomerase family protein [Actinomycetospora sp. OC33-EN08]|uniref:Enoyl-CoA hydratase/isomerase family protein n=1 Tax=Actinomycetospora aurantiaca TaxID=3129233 RepID=A0ABU8MT57_9PSEU
MEGTEEVELLLDRAENRAIIQLGRAFVTRRMARRIVDHLDTIDADDDVKVVVIENTGPDLSRGWDPDDAWRQFIEAPGGAVRKHPSQRARLEAFDESWWGDKGLYRRLLHCRKVTVVKAVGECFETGLFLAVCADLVVAGTGARFAVPRWHSLGADGDLSLLIATVGLKRTSELAFAGRIWDAARAERTGLVDQVADDVDATVDGLAAMCASIMRDGIVTEKYAVFASLATMGVDHSFAAATVVGASLSNIHHQPDEFNFLAEARRSGADEAVARSRSRLSRTEPS